MLQGFYIFVIFVCKRNVRDAILKRFQRGNTYRGQSTGGTAKDGISLMALRKKGRSRKDSTTQQPSNTSFTRMNSNYSEQGTPTQLSSYQPLVQSNA